MKNKKHLTIFLLSVFIFSCSKNELELTQQNEKLKIENKHSYGGYGENQPPSMGTVTQEVKQIIAENIGIEINDVKLESNLIDDLGADELNLMEIVMDIEEEFEIEVFDEDAEKLYTVGQYIDFAYSRLKTVTFTGNNPGIPYIPPYINPGLTNPGGTNPGGFPSGETPSGGSGSGTPNNAGDNLGYFTIMDRTLSVESFSPNVIINNVEHNVSQERKKAYKWEIAYNPFVYWKVISHETGTHKKVNNEWHWKTLEHNNFSVIDNLSIISVTVSENGQAISTLGLYYAGIEVGCNVKATMLWESVPVGASPKDYRKNSPLFFSNTP